MTSNVGKSSREIIESTFNFETFGKNGPDIFFEYQNLNNKL